MADNKTVSERIVTFVTTFCYLGYAKGAPGTISCLGGVILYLFIRENIALYVGVTTILLILGFAMSGTAEDIFRRRDARQIVIDDVCGLLIALFLIPFSYKNLIVVFLLFRVIDIFKPFPIKRAEALSGSLGIMADDILAGIYANLLFRLALHFLHI